MTTDLALGIQLLRSSEVVCLSIDEETCLHVLDVHDDLERSVRLDGAEVRGIGELGGRHVVDRGNGADGGGVAGAGLDLLAIGDRKVGGQAVVDEVVRGSQGPDLTSGRDILTVIGEAFGNDSGVES